MLSGWLLVASRVPAGWGSVLSPGTYTRRDAGQYLSIASHGYLMRFTCHRGPHTLLAHVHVCGNVTWFAGYPAVIRALSVTGLGVPTAGLAVAWAWWYLMLLMVWLLCGPTGPPGRGGHEGPLGQGSRGGPLGQGSQTGNGWRSGTRWLCLLLAAFFPGQVYFAAQFPLAMAAFGSLACCYWSARLPRWPLAAAAGLVAGSSYLATVALLPGLAVAFLVTRDRRSRAAMCWGAAGVAAGVVAVLAYAQAAVGHWNAYFTTERLEYHVGLHDPFVSLVDRYEGFVPLPGTAARSAVAEQGFLVALLLVLAVAGLVACARAGLTAVDVMLAIMAAGAWLIPYVGGGHLAVYRAEALLVVIVPLLRRLPAWLLLIPLALAIWVAAAMAPAFLSGTLV